MADEHGGGVDDPVLNRGSNPNPLRTSPKSGPKSAHGPELDQKFS